jgi:hypothetical protein
MSLRDLFGPGGSPRDKVVRKVRRLYGTRADEVMQELDRYEGSVVADRDRVHRAILKLHDGTLDNLRRWVQVALEDDRDVLGPAEHPGPTTAAEICRFNDWRLDEATTRETSFAGMVEGIPEEDRDRAGWTSSPCSSSTIWTSRPT